MEQTNIEINIADYIPHGHANAINRKALSNMLGISDRRMRLLINKARKEGEPIINLQDSSGYYIADNVADLLAQYRINDARVTDIIQQQHHIARRIKHCGYEV